MIVSKLTYLVSFENQIVSLPTRDACATAIALAHAVGRQVGALVPVRCSVSRKQGKTNGILPRRHEDKKK